MKKTMLLAAMLITVGAGRAFAGHFIDVLPPASTSGCTPVSNGYDYNCTTDNGAPVLVSTSPVIIGPKSLGQLNALAPLALGELAVCTNCTRSYLCASSGTAAGAWVVAVETGTESGIPTHCQ